ncbi:hypothetical protein [Bifidobacterium callitrichidarum]|uniref:Cell surface protein n=1 Tax=Bifidobacterium callitrichidarum TaxID=2052941 RepID=A0A2U2N9B3_9BIFI|nr:hypothetical protein [Bifidobacterium callitrichidarum]PWG65678.1 hypothetical protein DF196_07020 [Bifidobacterium callitrichidarum]
MSETKQTVFRKTVAGMAATAALLGTMGGTAITASAVDGGTGDSGTTAPEKKETWTVKAGDQTADLVKDKDGNLLGTITGYQGIPGQYITITYTAADGTTKTANAYRYSEINERKDGTVTYTVPDSGLKDLGGVKSANVTVSYIAPETFYLKDSDGKQIPLTYDAASKTWNGTAPAATSAPGKTYTVYSYKTDAPINLTRDSLTAKSIDTTDVFGVFHVVGTADYSGQKDASNKFHITQPADYQSGDEIKAKDQAGKYTVQFVKQADGSFKPASPIVTALSGVKGNSLNTPLVKQLELSNGNSVSINWGSLSSSQVGKDHIFSMTGSASGGFSLVEETTDNAKDFKATFKYSAQLTASRTETKWFAAVSKDKNIELTPDENGDMTASTDMPWSNAAKSFTAATVDGTENVTLKLGGKTINDKGQQVATYNGTTNDGRTITVNVTVANYKWTAKVDGKTIQFTYKDGAWTASVKDTHKASPDKTLTATDGETKVTLNYDGVLGTASSTSKFGVININGTANYKNDEQKFKLDVPVNYDYGKLVTYDQDGDKPGEFTQDKDSGLFTTTAPTATLDDQDKPDDVSITLNDSEKTKITVPLGEKQQTVDEDKTRHAVRTGSIEGEYKVTDPASNLYVTQRYKVDATATRTWNDSLLSLNVLERNPENPKENIPVDIKFDAQTHDYTVERPYESTNNGFTLGYKLGADATVTPVSVSVGANGTRILTMTLNKGKDTEATYTVTVKFASADIKADSPAKLTGIYVNKTGENVQGQLVDGWNPNRLDYTITVGENDPSPYVLPTFDKDAVDVHPGKVTQTADSVKQEWVVVDKASGASRTYSLTVVREHSWKTAVEEFKPADPIAQKTTVDPENDSDASLVSHGYVTKDGTYVAVDKDDYQIPEGATFSYEGKTGQSIGVVSQLTTGMTYQYTVTVLPKDMSFPQQHVFTVTYITAKTNYASLTGILVNGKKIEGFNPDKHEYKVPVNRADQWMVSPQYDKLTGMSVNTDKNGADAVITVTSGDGLTSVQYKVHVYENPALAATGVNGAIVGISAVILAVIAAIVMGINKLLRRKNGTDINAADIALDDDGKPAQDSEEKKD